MLEFTKTTSSPVVRALPHLSAEREHRRTCRSVMGAVVHVWIVLGETLFRRTLHKVCYVAFAAKFFSLCHQCKTEFHFLPER